jgi:hypothetical protein
LGAIGGVAVATWKTDDNLLFLTMNMEALYGGASEGLKYLKNYEGI